MSNQLIPIFVGLITAIATLTAVFITSYFNMKSLEKNLRFQSQMALLHKDLKCKAPLIEPNLRRNLGKWAT